MSRERWGTFSVRDHTRKQPFAADVLMYDRLVIPRPSDPAEESRWSKAGWDPDRLNDLLDVLHADEPQGHAVTVKWNKYTRNLFGQRVQTAKIVDEEAKYGTTARLLATELLPAAPAGIIRAAIVAAYPSVAAAQQEWVANPDQEQRETLTFALAHQFLIPDPRGKTDLDLLQEAVDLADNTEFRTKRAQMYKWQEDVIHMGISDANALEEMAQYVAEYNAATKGAVDQVHAKFAFTLFPIAITALAGLFDPTVLDPIAPAAGMVHIANLVRFWVFDRKPVVQAGDSQAAAMFHAAQWELGWRPALVQA